MENNCCQIKGIVKQMNEYDKNLFHFTKLDSAVKILSTGKLRFGKLEDMNDIAECSLSIYSEHLVDSEIEKELKKYKLICFAKDDIAIRGYGIDSMWGHYAEKGNGVCIVFHKQQLESELKRYSTQSESLSITYKKDATNTVFVDGDKSVKCADALWEDRKELFFTKSTDWKYEQEYRFLIRSDNEEDYLPISDCIKAVIVCSPKTKGNKIKGSIPYQVLKHIENHPPILCYQQSLGNKELICYECVEPHRVDDAGEIDV